MRTQQFQEALSTRDTVGQAKGILMERYDLDDQTAFNTLIKLSQCMNASLRDIARRVIEDATGRCRHGVAVLSGRTCCDPTYLARLPTPAAAAVS